MTDPRQPSGIEKVAGSLVTEAVLTVAAALAGGPLAPLLPVLAKSLAGSRQQQRVQLALSEVCEELERNEAAVRSLTDEQYKLINESVLAMLQTTQTEKLAYLRCAVSNALNVRDMSGQEAIVLSRVIRDISAEEVAFLLRAFAYEGVLLNENIEQSEVLNKVLLVAPSSQDALSVTGLQSLGLLTPPETGWDSGAMRFTRLVAKLIALLRKPDA